jgi:polysaccharide export outer membrane protein
MTDDRLAPLAKIMFLLLATLAACAGQSQPQAALPAAASPVGSGVTASDTDAVDHTFQRRHPRYMLRPGDTFDLFFELTPEFNQTVTVQPDGYITLRGIGDIHVSDKTVPQLTATLRSAYAKTLNEPLISILLKDFEKPYFIADGQVGRPGKYDLRGDTTLTQAIAMAGGFLDSAKHSQVLLFRRASEGWFSAQIFDVKKMEKDGDLHEDPHLHPGDMLFVPKNRFSKIRPFIPGASLGTMFKPY